MNPAKKLIAFILSVSMLVSLCPSFNVTFTAETTEETIESTETPLEIQRDFESEYGSIVSKEYYPQTDIPSAVISSTEPVTVYDDVLNGTSYGVTSENLTGLQIWLEQCIVYENGNIIYRYSLVDKEHEFQNTALTYQFIPAEYITPASNFGTDDGFTYSEEGSIVEDTGIRLDFVVENESPEGVNIGYPTATITSTNLNIYANQTYGSLGVNVGDASGEVIELLLSFTYSNGEVIYQFAYRGTTNAALAEAAVDYYFISAKDIVINGGEEQPEEVVKAYESLIKAATLEDFDDAYDLCDENGYFDSFTNEQWTEINRIEELLFVMEESTVYLDEYSLTGAPSVEGAKLYLNPYIWPDDYVILNLDNMVASLTVEAVYAAPASVEGEYESETGEEYYIIDTSTWTDFADKIPYKYISKSDFTFDNKWTKENKNGVFTTDDVKVYDHSLATYYQLDNGTSLGSFEVLYSFVTVEFGIETKWYVIKTNNWTDAYGNTVTGKFVKAECVSTGTVLTDISGVSVSADIPSDVTLSVSPKTLEESGLDQTLYPISGASLFYDVTLEQNGSSYQPANGLTVTFPESAVTASGLEVGDNYNIYHIHEGVTDVTGPYEYTGGSISADFPNLSVVGYGETDSVSLKDLFGDLVSNDPFYAYGTFKEDAFTVYGAVDTASASAIDITGVLNAPIEILRKAVFSNGDILYQVNYIGTDSAITDVFKNLGDGFVHENYISFTCTCNCGNCKGTETCNCCENCTCGESSDTSDVEEIYNQLMATETLEEWNAIEDTLTEDQLNALYSLEESKVTALEDHYNNLPTAVQKSYNEVTAALLGSATVAEYDAWLQTITPEVHEMILSNHEMHQNLINFIDALLAAEDTSPKNVTNYTNAAPFVSPVTGIEPITPFNLLRTASVMDSYVSYAASRTAETDITDAEGVVTSKNVVMKSDGVYTVTLETYVTGSKVTQKVEKHIPTDIIVIVDQSGSMARNISSYIYTDYNEKFNKKLTASEIFADYSNYETRNNTYVKIGDKYEKVTVERNPVSSSTTSLPVEIDDGTRNNAYYNTYGNNGTLYYKVDNNYLKVYVTRDQNYKYTYTLEDGVIIYESDNYAYNDRVIKNDQRLQFYRFETTTEYVYNYTFTYKGADSTTVTYTYNADDVVPTGEESTAVPNGTYYFREATTEPRLDALTRALGNFVTQVEEKTVGIDGIKGSDDDVDHRIAIVGFSSNSSTYHNTEILTGCTITGENRTNWYDPDAGTPYYYPYKASRNGVAYQNIDVTTNPNNAYAIACGNALQYMSKHGGDANTNGIYDGVENVRAAIDAITAHGGTNTHEGLDMAVDIFAKNPIPSGEQRNRVVVLFTDGDISDTSNRTPAISNAYSLKNTYGATVYTVGIFDGANATIKVENNGTDASIESNTDSNRFMHYISNNYKNATAWNSPGTPTFHKDSNNLYTGKSYYLSAGDADALNNIFQTISEDVQNDSKVYELDETTVIKDIVAPNFSVPEGASDVKVYTAATTGMNGLIPSFADRVERTDVTVTVDKVTSSVNITGFNFADNWVGTETVYDTVTPHGSKLIIEFDIPVDPDFLGGNQVKTNGDESGVYVPVLDENGAPTGEYTLVENFTHPTVDIALKAIEPVWNNQHIYYSNNADIKAMFDGATINGTSITEVINGVNNAYVNVVLTVDGIGTYTIPAGHSFFTTDEDGNTVYGGTWELSDGANYAPQLNVDTAYTFSWTITPINPPKNGTVDDIESAEGDKTAWVYVYNPVLKFKDDVAYLGEVVPDISNNQVGNVVWVNESQGTAISGNMHGAEPQLEITYAIVADATNNDVIVTANDIPVNVTVKREDNGTVLTDKVTFEHQDCDGSTPETMPVFSSTTENNVTVNDYAEFVIHVQTVSLEISKEVVGIDTNEKFTVIVQYTADNAFTYENLPIGDPTDDDPFTIDIDGGKATITLSSMVNGMKVFLTGLPIGTYTVTENDYSPKYVTTTVATNSTVTDNRSATFTLSSTTQSGSVTFTNTINLTSLTIYKEASGTTYNVKDSFIFNVYEGTGNTLYATVVLQAGEYAVIPDLVVGTTYTVVEDTGWSWRYSCSDKDITKTLVYDEKEGTANSSNLYSFKNTVVTPLYWLDNESKLENRWSTSGIEKNYYDN